MSNFPPEKLGEHEKRLAEGWKPPVPGEADEPAQPADATNDGFPEVEPMKRKVKPKAAAADAPKAVKRAKR